MIGMSTLPIEAHLASLQETLDSHNRLILVAQPGAGKTTRVPLTLLNSHWAQGKTLLLLEPRRVVARLAAGFMARQLNESVGHTVGYRMRGDSQVSRYTRLEVVTQGVLTRMLQDDPLLEGVGGIIFDEFHERSIEADLGLALALDVQQSIRDDLRLIVMSATIDVAALQKVLGEQTPVIESTGRQYPVETIYWPVPRDTALETRVCEAVGDALNRSGSRDILVILPGVAEINRLVKKLEDSSLDIEVRALHGRMPVDAQQAALQQDASRPRVIVSTAIAESSVTVDGVNVVIDAGLERVPLFQPRLGLTQLTTRWVNSASADQRRGRAGRQGPGLCFRLWSQEQPLVPFGEPEIQQADLSRLVLELASWGVQSPDDLTWMTLPPSGAWQSGKALLAKLGIIDRSGMLTPLGEQCARWPVAPRLAAMLVKSVDINATALACGLAALLESRDRINGSLRDALAQRFSQPARYPQWQRDTKRLARIAQANFPAKVEDASLGALLALAYPERIGQRISPGRFKLANGKTATLPVSHPLANEPYLVAVNVEGATSEATIYVAEPLSLDTLISLYPATQQWVNRVCWSDAQGRLIGERVQCHGELVLATAALGKLPEEDVMAALLNALEQRPDMISTPPVQQLQGRMAILHASFEGRWPDWSDNALITTLETWLAPYMAGVTRMSQMEKMPFETYLQASLTWDQQSQLERLAPTLLRVPSGRQIALDYVPCLQGRPPVLALKLQEAFGWQETPRIVDGRVAVMIHLLSPAGRPLQITQDLRSFWSNVYPEVRKEMRGRYPKHPWPENPLSAAATGRTNSRR
ncbi:ATP-dependent helicase HrpB [Vreelandella subterranea]|uniref:ATP-dependent helicase HrpB n=2 Tax=Vreelandella subterranea TaxID=416874 RepID=A0A1H9V9K4_9GAMM|nr:ATP-dependent helicase HrpB [Halomonas subterranea]